MSPSTRTTWLVLALGGVLLVADLPLAHADRFDDAERMAERFVEHARELRRLDIDQLRALVQAICDAEEDDRRSVAREAGERARDKVTYEFEKLEREKNDALATLGAVMNDAAFKDKHGRAGEHKRRVEETWESVRHMTEKVRGANHPVVSFMLETGQRAHRERQSNSSYCHEAEFGVAGGRADCLYASGTICYAIEFKPRNSRSLDLGRRQAKRYRDELNRADSSDRKRLMEQNSRFKDCKAFEERVDCYRLCPDIDENGEFRAVSIEWSTGC